MSEHAENFIDHLDRMRDQNRGAFAELRRSLSFAPGTYPPAYPYVERFVVSESNANHPYRQALYLVAGLFALHPQAGRKSLASNLGELMRNRDSESIEKRFIALLGADPENLPNYLRQIITLLAADGLGVNYGSLLSDLGRWLNPYDIEARDKVRQRWARDFYRELAPREAAPETVSSVTEASY